MVSRYKENLRLHSFGHVLVFLELDSLAEMDSDFKAQRTPYQLQVSEDQV